jgi:hypothetical protein
MKRITPILGYTAAGLTIVAAVVGPLLLFGPLMAAVASAGLRVAPFYTGGEADHVIHKAGYQIVVNRPVTRRTLFSTDEFVQITWKPAAALPAKVVDAVDLSGDGPDLVVGFDVPNDVRAPLRVDVQPLTARVTAMRGVGREGFTRLIARVGDAVVVRVPLRKR